MNQEFNEELKFVPNSRIGKQTINEKFNKMTSSINQLATSFNSRPDSFLKKSRNPFSPLNSSRSYFKPENLFNPFKRGSSFSSVFQPNELALVDNPFKPNYSFNSRKSVEYPGMIYGDSSNVSNHARKNVVNRDLFDAHSLNRESINHDMEPVQDLFEYGSIKFKSEANVDNFFIEKNRKPIGEKV